ncbi:unnamed protein product [Nezara viridula]|uniref:Uncharacterized protein n=1 Tax=Nezara viridula TaxID=85310 RepID=A0A9P0E7E9_NEZVI|nr:unnamed protein product [Nezara viridula]
MCKDDEDPALTEDLVEESDISSDDEVEEREDGSETEQEAESSSEEEDEELSHELRVGQLQRRSQLSSGLQTSLKMPLKRFLPADDHQASPTSNPPRGPDAVIDCGNWKTSALELLLLCLIGSPRPNIENPLPRPMQG